MKQNNIYRSGLVLLGLFFLTACAGRVNASSSTPTPTSNNLGNTATPILTLVTPTVVGTGAGASGGSGEPGQVTLADNGQTLHLTVGHSFLLNLGAKYNWTVTVDDQTILSREVNILVIRGAQSIYKALVPGETGLTANGDPACLQDSPPCLAPSQFFSIKVIVSQASPDQTDLPTPGK